MTRGVDESQGIGLAVQGLELERDALGLDGDAPLPLDGIGVQHLLFHLARFQASAELEEAVGERGFAVVDVGDDGEITDALHSHWRSRSR